MKVPGLEPVRILGHLLAARRRFTRFRDHAELARWQRRHLLAHLRWTARRSPFYRAWFAARPVADPADPGAWPRMDKAAVTANLPALLTRPVAVSAARALAEGAMATRSFAGQLPGGVSAGLSSGTTGPAALFLVSARERAAWAGLALARVLRETFPRGGEQRVAFFLRANSPLYESVGARRSVRFVYFDLLTPLTRSFGELERLAPTVLVAPPGVLRMLAATRRAGELRGVTPRQVVSVAETLEADDRAAVEAAFGVRVDEVYQATEGFLAATCAAGALHWNEDVVHVEREPVPGGGGRYVPVLTDFRRRLQPFVRYRLDDVLTDVPDDAPPCPCGSVFRRLQRIEGRRDDVLQFPRRDGTGVGALFPDFVRLAVAGAAGTGLEDFRVGQTGPDTLAVSLRPENAGGDGFLPRLHAALAGDCARAGLQTPVCRLAPWPENVGQKRRRVIGPDRAGASHA